MSFQFGGQNFTPKEYYRDDALALAVLRSSRRNPVLITGLRRIGKTWFLRRLSQILEEGKTRHFVKKGIPNERQLEAGLPMRVRLFDGDDAASRAELLELLGRGEPDTLAAVDEFEGVVADSALVRAILAHRGPLVLAAAPILHEHAQRNRELVAFFETRCEHRVLRPLSDLERRALVRQTWEPDKDVGVPGVYQAFALRREWGGHPMVLQQICSVIREERLAEVQEVHDRAYARLNEGPQYGKSLVDRGLMSTQREVLFQVASGVAARDEHALTQLHDHGAIVRGAGGAWQIENRVLEQYVRAALRQPRIALPPPPPPEPVPPAKPRRVFSWIHLSDLHFGAGTAGYRFDHKAVMRAIERDLAARGGVDRVFVTGDIAFSARLDEYTEARSWLERILKTAGIGLDRIRFVPGNHDVDRQIVKNAPLLRSAHHAARDGRVELDDLIADKAARAVLAAKLEPYRSFVANFADHPAPLEDNGIDWVEILDTSSAGHGPLRIAGLSTVWISDDLDGKDLNGKGFVRNLALAHAQIERTSGVATPNELTLMLTHHPPEWIAPTPSGVDLLEREFARLPHIHLFGHVHDAKAGSTKRYGRSGRSLWYVAGAAHSDPSEAAKHGYAWGALRHDPAKATWQAGWAPRVYIDGEMHDATGRGFDADGFAWEAIECPWPAPAR